MAVSIYSFSPSMDTRVEDFAMLVGGCWLEMISAI